MAFAFEKLIVYQKAVDFAEAQKERAERLNTLSPYSKCFLSTYSCGSQLPAGSTPKMSNTSLRFSILFSRAFKDCSCCCIAE